MPTAKPKLLHIFKPGRWTTMAGEVLEFSRADLEATAAAYNPSVGKAPIVIGHPATDDPAQGWAQTLCTTARGLFAQPAQVDPAFAESVRTGRYGTVSAKFYRPQDPNNPVPGIWYLRHIGFLGAQNPSIKGLDDPEFSAPDDGCVCFQEGVAYAEDGTSADVPPQSQPPQESTVTEEEAARLRDESTAKDRRIAELEEQQRAAAAAAALAANTAFAEQMASEARILPAQVAQVAAIGQQLQATPDVEFGEGDAKKPLAEAFRDFLRGLPPQVAFSEQATRDRVEATTEADDVAFSEGADPQRLAQHKAALAYAKEHKTTYAVAARAVIK